MMLNGFGKNKIVPWNRLTVGAITFTIVLIFNYLFQKFPILYEYLYLKGFFQILRIVHDYTIGLLPFPNFYLILPLFLFYFFNKKCSSIKTFAIAFITCLLWIVNLFYILWGFNYHQPSIYESLDLTPVQLDSIYIKKTFLDQTKTLEKLVLQKSTAVDFSELEKSLRSKQEAIITKWGLPILGRVRIRKLPGGALLRIRTSGIYIPHAFEGHIDGGTYYKQHPFTLAHEMAHGYGYTDESVCNFIAYLTCRSSDIGAIRYSGELAYWRYLARHYKELYPNEWSENYENLHPILLEDLHQIRQHIIRYPDLLPKMKDIIYDNYLKTHGIKEGIKSYDKMIELIAAYNQSSN